MIDLYVTLVIAGKRTCDENNKDVKIVPEEHRADVLEVLKKKGYDANGQKIY